MNKEVFDNIAEDLKETIRFLSGEDTSATVYTPIDLKAIRKKQKLSQSKNIKKMKNITKSF